MTTDKPIKLVINLDHVFVRLMGVIENALTFRQFAVHGDYDSKKVNDFRSLSESAISWQLSRPISEEKFSSVKQAYVDWAVANCVRHMVEGLHTFLDENILACTLIEKYQGAPIPRVDFDKVVNEIRKSTNFTDKLARLNQVLNIAPERIRQLHTLNNIRNCLSHNSGIATEHHFPDVSAGRRVIGEWVTAKLFIVGENSGKKSKLEFGKKLNEPSSVFIQFERKLKKILDGKPVRFSCDELNEIGFTVQQVARDITNQMINKYAASTRDSSPKVA